MFCVILKRRETRKEDAEAKTRQTLIKLIKLLISLEKKSHLMIPNLVECEDKK